MGEQARGFDADKRPCFTDGESYPVESVLFVQTSNFVMCRCSLLFEKGCLAPGGRERSCANFQWSQHFQNPLVGMIRSGDLHNAQRCFLSPQDCAGVGWSGKKTDPSTSP